MTSFNNSYLHLLKKKFQYIWDSPTITTWATFLSSGLKTIVFYPLLISRLDSPEITIWLLFLSFVGFASLLDLGFYSTFSRLISYIIGGADKINNTNSGKVEISSNSVINNELFGKAIRTINSIFIILALLVFVLFLTIGSFYMQKPISMTSDPKTIWISFIVLIISLSLSVYARKFRTVLHGMNYISLINRWNLFFDTISVLLSIIVLVKIPSVLNLTLVLMATVFSSLLRDYFLLKSRIDAKTKIIDDDNKQLFYPEIIAIVWPSTWRTAIGMIGSTGVTEATGLIYAQYNSSNSLASYLFALRIISIISSISRAPFYSKIPTLTINRANNELHNIYNLSKRGIKISLYIFTLLILCVGLFINPMLNMIKSNIQFISINLWVFISVVWMLERHHAMHAQVYSTTNHIPFYIPIIVSGTINILLIFLLIDQLGIWSFTIAQGFSNILINNWWNVKLSLNSMQVEFKKYFSETLIKPLIFFIFCLGIIIISNACIIN